MIETKAPTLVERLRAELVERRQQLHYGRMTEQEREWLRDLISWLEQQIARQEAKASALPAKGKR